MTWSHCACILNHHFSFPFEEMTSCIFWPPTSSFAKKIFFHRRRHFLSANICGFRKKKNIIRVHSFQDGCTNFCLGKVMWENIFMLTPSKRSKNVLTREGKISSPSDLFLQKIGIKRAAKNSTTHAIFFTPIFLSIPSPQAEKRPFPKVNPLKIDMFIFTYLRSLIYLKTHTAPEVSKEPYDISGNF